MFTIEDIKGKGFVETHSTEGMCQYSRFYDEVPEEVRNEYDNHKLDFSHIKGFGGKDYIPRNLFRGGKPYFFVYEKLMDSSFEKGDLKLSIAYRKENGIVEAVYCVFGADWGDKYDIYDCRKISFGSVMEDLRNLLLKKREEVCERFEEKLKDVIDTHISVKRIIDSELRELQEGEIL